MAKAAKSDKTDATKAVDAAKPADSAKSSGRKTRKLVPLEKRLNKLRKEETKRKAQLDRVQARSAETKTEMSTLIATVNDWVQKPE